MQGEKRSRATANQSSSGPYQPSQSGSYAIVTEDGLSSSKAKKSGSDPSAKKVKAAKPANVHELTKNERKVYDLASFRLWYDYCVFINLFPDPDTVEKKVLHYWSSAQVDHDLFDTDITKPAQIKLMKLVSPDASFP